MVARSKACENITLGCGTQSLVRILFIVWLVCFDYKILSLAYNCFPFCGCETWTLLADSEERIQAFETKCLRKLLRISSLEHETNDWLQSKIDFLVGPQEPPLATVEGQKLAWFGHVARRNSLSKTILQGSLEGGRGNAGWTTLKREHPCPCQNC